MGPATGPAGSWSKAPASSRSARSARWPRPSHTWAELAPHLEPGPIAAFVAHERVLRGEDLRADPSIDRRVLELPLVLEAWEPPYRAAAYHPDHVEAPPPDLPPLTDARLPAASAITVDDDTGLDALRELVAPGTASSNGRVDLAAVEGDHLAAIAALGVPEARLAEVTPAEAFAWMAWAAPQAAPTAAGEEGRRGGSAPGGRPPPSLGCSMMAAGGRRPRRHRRRAALVRLGRLRAAVRLAAPPRRLGPGRRRGLGHRRHRRRLTPIHFARRKPLSSASAASDAGTTHLARLRPLSSAYAASDAAGSGQRAVAMASREVRRRSRVRPTRANSHTVHFAGS